jgi:F0F1-type ATP synthase assembly protein I
MDAKEGVGDVANKGKGILGKLGPIFFLLGVIIAIVVGLLLGAEVIERADDNDTWGYIAAALTGLGFLVGIVTILGTGTITKEEITQFLVCTIALVVVGIAGQQTMDIPLIGEYLGGVTLCMVLFFAPASVIIALKTLWDLGKD